MHFRLSPFEGQMRTFGIWQKIGISKMPPIPCEIRNADQVFIEAFENLLTL